MTQAVLLGDICDIKIGRTPPRKETQWFSVTGGNKWVSIKDMGNAEKSIFNTSEYLTNEAVEKFKVPVIKSGTLLLSFKLTVGRLGFVTEDMCSNEAIAQLPINNPETVDKNWLYYYLKNFDFNSLSSTSSIATAVNSQTIKNIRIELSDLKTQKKIADILGTIDEKIELNRRINDSMEQMGQALFRHYFIDNHEAEEWEEVKIGELVNIKGGGTPSTKNPDFWNGNIAWTSPRDLTGKNDAYLLATDKAITEAGLAKISSGLLPERTLLLSSRAPIGYVAMAGLPLAINQGYIAFLPDAYLSNHFMYFWLHHNMEHIKNAANGSTFMEISKTAFRNITTAKPDEKSLREFENETKDLFEAMRNNQKQTQTLTTLRDSLLPRLINGKVKV